MTSLILTADDFGRSEAVNHAIAAWARAGVLTQTSLMVNEPAAEAAIQLAREEFPAATIGLHLTLCDGLASDGTRLAATPAAAGMKYAFWPGARAWLQKEIAAQFQRFADLGMRPTYWDGHTHLHLHPVVMDIALPIAAQFGFRFTRLVREPGPPALIPWIFQQLSKRAAPKLKAAGIGYADAVFGLRNTGKMSARDFEQAIAFNGTLEIYFHPGADPQLPSPEWVAERLRR